MAATAVAGGALSLGYATAAMASPAPLPADTPQQASEAVRTETTVAPITASAKADWGVDELPQVEVTPLWEQPAQIKKARALASDPEVVATAAVHLRTAADGGAESLAVLADGTKLGTDADEVTRGDFTRVYTKDGLTGFVASHLLDNLADLRAAEEAAAAKAAEEAAATAAASTASTASTTSTATTSVASSTSASYSSIVAAAQSQIGSAYVYASATPGAFDCSGLVSWSYAQVGISVPHSSSAVRAVGTVISASEARPGDVIWSPGHVSIYAGGNQQIEAVGPGSGVQQTSIWQSSPVFLRF
ncbi:C40 family peptidase [Demequina soli]|uniref:C40 family peptidase n=1 Tax=Demequina soli TaxID=1638987 RepID=UPI0007819998|nr:SH3 domain-containing C40 family peptidase [Demequina soli]